MKQKRYTEEQIIGSIKQHESGVKVDEICRQMNISSGTFYCTPSALVGQFKVIV
jgi:putative transposase